MTGSKRLDPKTLAADRDALLALQDVPDYAPRNPSYSVAILLALAERLTMLEQAEARARRAYELSRDEAIAAGIALHNAMRGARNEVITQFGEDSHVIEMVGLKKRSAYKRPRPRVKLAAS